MDFDDSRLGRHEESESNGFADDLLGVVRQNLLRDFCINCRDERKLHERLTNDRSRCLIELLGKKVIERRWKIGRRHGRIIGMRSQAEYRRPTVSQRS